MRVELVQHMGTDLTVVNSARVSFDKESEWEDVVELIVEDHPVYGEMEEEITHKFLSDKDKKLINYLAKHNHFTPFTHNAITIRETVPIFVARQRFKHVVGFTYNEVSRRYVDDVPEFYYPDVWRGRPEGNAKQGSSKEVTIEQLEWEVEKEIIGGYPRVIMGDANIHEAYKQLIEHSEWLYTTMIDNGVAPEQSRMVLPQSMYTSYYTTGSLSAWARAYNLRIDSHAQQEIRELAVQWDKIIQPLFPVSWKALTGEN